MKIDEITKNITLVSSFNELAQPGRRGEVEQRGPSVPQNETEGTQVELSSASMEFRRVAEAMENEAPERVAKIAELTARIREGTYSVEPSKVAGKILQDALTDWI